MNSSEFDLRSQCACARRELGKRRFVYPRLIASGKMSPEAADKEEACMEAILVTLTKLLIEESKRGELPLFDRTAPQS
jgi:hypothetical protein